MAWTAPMTAVAGATFTAAQFNQYVRDNLNETAVAKASAASQIFVSTGPNALAARVPSAASVATTQSSSTIGSYLDLTTPGPALTLTTGTIAIVMFSASMSNNSTNSATFTSVAVSGASSVAASDAWCLLFDGNAASNFSRGTGAHIFTGLTAGSNTFTMKYKVGSSTGNFSNREINVIPL
jgi:hypothetical protein